MILRVTHSRRQMPCIRLLGEYPDLLWIMAQESMGVPGIQNGSTTASGLFQLLEKQRQEFYPNGNASMGNPEEEAQSGIRRSSVWGQALLVLKPVFLLGLILGLACMLGPAIAKDTMTCLEVPVMHRNVLRTPAISSADDHRFADDLGFYQDTRGIDFAGHFTLAQIGCGAGCIRLAAIDALSGYVHWFGRTLTSWPTDILVPLSYRSDSRLLGVLGALDEAGDTGWHWFAFDGTSFIAMPGPPAGCRPAPPPRD